MALIKKNVLKQAPIVHQWPNHSAMTNNLWPIRYQTKLLTRDKNLHPWPNCSPVTKRDQTFHQ